MKTATIEKSALGSGPWLINDDRTIWAADQPYVANRSVNTVWMRPANTELTITARRLDGDAPRPHRRTCSTLQHGIHRHWRRVPGGRLLGSHWNGGKQQTDFYHQSSRVVFVGGKPWLGEVCL